MASRKPPAKKVPAKKAPAKKAAPRKVGRPSLFSDKLASVILSEMANNDVSLRQICSRPGMPHRNTVNRWLATNPDFATKYAHAREGQADVVFERMGELEQQVLLGKVDPKAARVVLESRRWRAEKLKPKVYGQRMRLDAGENTAVVVFRDLTGRKDEGAAA